MPFGGRLLTEPFQVEGFPVYFIERGIYSTTKFSLEKRECAVQPEPKRRKEKKQKKQKKEKRGRTKKRERRSREDREDSEEDDYGESTKSDSEAEGEEGDDDDDSFVVKDGEEPEVPIQGESANIDVVAIDDDDNPYSIVATDHTNASSSDTMEVEEPKEYADSTNTPPKLFSITSDQPVALDTEGATQSTPPSPPDNTPTNSTSVSDVIQSPEVAIVDEQPDSRKRHREHENIADVKMEKTDKETIVLTGIICRELTSPYVKYRLLIKKKNDLYEVVSILSAYHEDPITGMSIAKAAGRSNYIGSSSESSRKRAGYVKTLLKQVFQTLSLSLDSTIPEDALSLLAKSDNTTIAKIFNNISRPSEYYGLSNILGPEVSRELTNKEVLQLNNIEVSSDKREKYFIFQRIAYKHKIPEDSLTLFYPEDPELKYKLDIEHKAYDIYHSLREQMEKYGNTIFSEGDIRWDDDVFAILQNWSHLIRTGSRFSTITGLEHRFIQDTQAHERDTKMADIINSIPKVSIICDDIDFVNEGTDNYFARLRTHLSGGSKSETLIITSVTRRIELIKQWVYGLQTIGMESVLSAEVKSVNNSKSITKSLKPINNTPSKDNSKLRAFGNMPKREEQRAIKTLVIDRAHYISDKDMITVLDKYKNSVKHLIVCGTNNCSSKDMGTFLAEMSNVVSSRVSVDKEVSLEDPLNRLDPLVKGYHESTDSLLKCVPITISMNVLTTNGDRRSELEGVMASSNRGMTARVYNIYSYDPNTSPPALLVIDTVNLKLGGLIKALQAGKHQIQYRFLGSKESVEEVFRTTHYSKKGNLAATLEELFVSCSTGFTF